MPELGILIEAKMLKISKADGDIGDGAKTVIEIRDVSKSSINAPLLKSVDSIDRYDADWTPVIKWLLDRYPGHAVKAKSHTGLNGFTGRQPDGTRVKMYEVV